MRRLIRYGLLIPLVAATPTACEAILIAGYQTGAGSQLLESNNPGAGGDTLFVDVAQTGGGDYRFDGGRPNVVTELTSLWAVGDQVTLTGLALPIWSVDPDSDGTNNTQNGVWTLTFYGLGGGADPGRFDGADHGEPAIGSAQIEFASAGTGVDAFYAVFDTPVSFTAQSTGVAFDLLSDTGSAQRFKVGPGAANITRRVRTSGALAPGGTDWSVSLAGRVVAVPEPAVGLFFGTSLALALVARRRIES